MISKETFINSKNEIIEAINNSSIRRPIRDIDLIEFKNNQGILGNLYDIQIIDPNDSDLNKRFLYKNQCCSDKNRESKVYDLLALNFQDKIPKKISGLTNGDIIIENLKGYKSGSIINSCKITEVKQVLHSIARIHSFFWERDPLPTDNAADFAGILQYNLNQNWEGYKSRYQSQLGDTIQDFEWLIENSGLTSRVLYSGNTLTHGDLHLENVMFSSSGLKIIDWQLAAKRTPAFDVSFFIIQNLSTEVRKSYEEELLEFYYSSLSEEVKKTYSFKRFNLEYRACLTRSMMTSVMMIGERFSNKKNQMSDADTMAERVIWAIKDLKPVDAILELGVE